MTFPTLQNGGRRIRSRFACRCTYLTTAVGVATASVQHHRLLNGGFYWFRWESTKDAVKIRSDSSDARSAVLNDVVSHAMQSDTTRRNIWKIACKRTLPD
ncbi:hypothetical protein Trydic_g10062 [Trypoxylus dichotomus]